MSHISEDQLCVCVCVCFNHGHIVCCGIEKALQVVNTIKILLTCVCASVCVCVNGITDTDSEPLTQPHWDTHAERETGI